MGSQSAFFGILNTDDVGTLLMAANASSSYVTLISNLIALQGCHSERPQMDKNADFRSPYYEVATGFCEGNVVSEPGHRDHFFRVLRGVFRLYQMVRTEFTVRSKVSKISLPGPSRLPWRVTGQGPGYQDGQGREPK